MTESSLPRLTFRRELRGSHHHLTVWVNGAQAGTLTVRHEESCVLDAIMSLPNRGGLTELLRHADTKLAALDTGDWVLGHPHADLLYALRESWKEQR